MSDALTQIGEIVAGEAPREAKAYAIAEVIRLARAYRWVGMYDVGAGEVQIVSWTGGERPAHPSFAIGEGLTSEAIAQARPVVADVATSPTYLPTFADTRSELIVPILARGAVRGTIDVESPDEAAFSDADVAFLERCASVLAPLWEVPVEYELPPNLPAPVDDGACDHLPGGELASLVLDSTHGQLDLGELGFERLALYVYPRAGGPGFLAPAAWDLIPGARGCTPESCSFRDHAAEFRALGARVAGLSVQTLDEQVELAERLHLPFPVIADPERKLGRTLGLPTFEFEGATLYKRLTLIVERRRIVRVFYPVFPPDRHGDEVLAWLRGR
jgi:peroxiredoxin/putative methionine-R-sulfoxide reductase with GAF domain